MKIDDDINLTYCKKHSQWFVMNCADCMIELNEDDIKQEGYRQALKDVGDYLDKNILSTDNRVTQLWVLAPTVKSLKQG